MKDGNRCEICSAVYGTESTIRYKPVGRSNFRFQCEGHNRDHLVHRYTTDGKLYRSTKRVYSDNPCPVCGYPSGVVGDPKTHAFCHVCRATFKQRGNIVVLTGLGKFANTPDWFTGEIEISSASDPSSSS